MNQRILIGAVIMAVSVMLSVSGIAFADKGSWDRSSDDGSSDDRGSRGGKDGGYKLFKRTSTVPAVTNKLYAEECGSCHFAYQPGWLPVRSWQKMMGELDQHFDENAELDQESRDAITQYLLTEAADVKSNRKSRKILRSIKDADAPQRISALRYIVSKHDEIPARLVAGNAKVGSAANCAACHTEASTGYFNEHGVKIPGHGPWED
jgi:hypothetical protein